MAQYLPLARAVDARRLQHLVGDRQAILADEEDAENPREPRHERAGIAVDEPHRLEFEEQRQHPDLSRHDERSDAHTKDRIAPREAQLGKGITRGEERKSTRLNSSY